MQHGSTRGSENEGLPHMSSSVCIASLLGGCKRMSIAPYAPSFNYCHRGD